MPSDRVEIAARHKCFGRFDLKGVNIIMYHISISIDKINVHAVLDHVSCRKQPYMMTSKSWGF